MKKILKLRYKLGTFLHYRLRYLVFFYLNLNLNLQKYKKIHVKNSQSALKQLFLLSQPKRQRHFNFYNFFTFSHIALSTGTLVESAAVRSKFFKKHKTNMLPVLVLLRFAFPVFFTQQLFLVYNNFNYSSYQFITKMIKLMPINFQYIFFKKAYIFQTGYPRRIKRRILRQLQEN